MHKYYLTVGVCVCVFLCAFVYVCVSAAYHPLILDGFI